MKISAMQKDSFLSWEVLWMGGASILAWMGFWAFSEKTASLVTISQFAYAAAFAMNHPHFLSSYALLYSDFKNNLLRKPRYMWAGIFAPVLLLCYLVFAFTMGHVALIGASLTAMFFLVGWHYVKQVFGCVIVTSARRKIFYTNGERRIMLSALFSLWGLSFVTGQLSTSYTFYGIIYAGLGLPAYLKIIGYAIVAFTTALLIRMHVRKYIETGVKPSPPGVIALVSLYVWYLPALAHPAFGYMIPFFHSMQYLTFVWSFKSNQVSASVKQLSGREQRALWIKRFFGFGFSVVVMGALAFEILPDLLDAQKMMSPVFGASPFMAAFLIFINVHHYFIDNAIWRSDNEQVKMYLFAPPADQALSVVPASKTA